MAYCEKCGTKLNDGAKFCQKCGYRINNEKVVPGTEDMPIDSFDEDGKSSTISNYKKILYVLLALVLLGTAWYGYKAYQEQEAEIEANIELAHLPEKKENVDYTEQDIEAMKSFLEDLYSKMNEWGQIDETLIKKSLTVKAQKKLQEYGNDCLTNDEGVGGQLSSHKITHVNANLFEACVTLYGMGDYFSHKVILGVVKEGSDYKIGTIKMVSEKTQDYPDKSQQDFKEKTKNDAEIEFVSQLPKLTKEIQQIMVQINNVYNNYMRTASTIGPSQSTGVNAVATISDLKLDGIIIFNELISLARKARKSEELKMLIREKDDFEKQAYQMENNINRTIY